MSVPVYLEAGRRRVFAAAVDWPGWARAGRDEPTALEALASYRSRYRAAVGRAGRVPPASDRSDFDVVERLAGGSGTDMGVLGAVPAADRRPVDEVELRHLLDVLRATWAAFDAAVAAAAGRALRVGRRGGGRTLEAIVAHVRDGDAAYTGRLGGSWQAGATVEAGRDAFEEALWRRARGELADRGPRGGVRWPVRYAVRRSAWHALDHAWEVEDRAGPVASG